MFKSGEIWQEKIKLCIYSGALSIDFRCLFHNAWSVVVVIKVEKRTDPVLPYHLTSARLIGAINVEYRRLNIQYSSKARRNPHTPVK